MFKFFTIFPTLATDEENRTLQYDVEELRKLNDDLKIDLSIANDRVRDLTEEINQLREPSDQSRDDPLEGATVQSKDFDDLYQQYQS